MLLPNRNPLVYRAVRVNTRPGLLVVGSLAILGVLLLAFSYIRLMAIDAQGRDFSWTYVYLRFAYLCLCLEIFLAFFVALGACLDRIVTERNRNTIEFLETLPLSPTDKVIGLCLSATLPFLVLGVILAVVGVVFGLAGGLSVVNLLWLQGLILAGYLASSLFGLLGSAWLGRFPWGWLCVIGMFFLSMTILGSLGKGFTVLPLWTFSPYAIFSASVQCGEVPRIVATNDFHFYTLPVPWQVCPLVFYLYLGSVFFLSARRALSRPLGMDGARWMTVLFAALLHVLLIGFLWDAFRHAAGIDASIGVLAYLILFSLLTLVWGLLTTPTPARSMQWVQRARPGWPIRMFTHAFWESGAPAVVPTVGLWVLAVAGATFLAKRFAPYLSLGGLMALGGLLLVFLTMYLLAYTTVALSARRIGKLLGVIVLAVLILVPTSFAIFPQTEFALAATPFGAITEYGEIIGPSNGCDCAGERYDRFVFAGESKPWKGAQFKRALGCGISGLAIFAILLVMRLRSQWKRSPTGQRARRS